MTARVFVCAGHELGGGAAANGLRENPYNARVGVLAVHELRARGIEAWLAPLTTRPYPDEVRGKARWVAQRSRPDDLAIDLHLDIEAPGCAVFARDCGRSLAMADLLAEHLARATRLRCRGGLPEAQTAAGRLWFLHNVGCRAGLVELCSMNTGDSAFAARPAARGAFATGLADGVQAVLEAG